LNVPADTRMERTWSSIAALTRCQFGETGAWSQW